MSDYGLTMPLWGCGADQDDARATALALGLSDRLTQDLVGWQRWFADHLATMTWDERANADAYADQARQLVARLRAELPNTSIELDLWPVDPEWMPVD